MNIEQVKAAIAASTGKPLPTLLMVRQTTEDGASTPWVSHWDNENRIRVTMHEDVLKKIKADPAKVGYAFKRQDVPANDERAGYTRFVVIEPTNVEATF